MFGVGKFLLIALVLCTIGKLFWLVHSSLSHTTETESLSLNLSLAIHVIQTGRCERLDQGSRTIHHIDSDLFLD